MKLTYNELAKREVINTVDGRSLGKICDIELDFPKGILTAIIVPGKKGCKLFNIFNRNKLYISRRDIVKIGGDVILVKLNCGNVCDDSVNVNPQPKKSNPCNSPNPCASPEPCDDVRKLFSDGDYEDY